MENVEQFYSVDNFFAFFRRPNCRKSMFPCIELAIPFYCQSCLHFLIFPNVTKRIIKFRKNGKETQLLNGQIEENRKQQTIDFEIEQRRKLRYINYRKTIIIIIEILKIVDFYRKLERMTGRFCGEFCWGLGRTPLDHTLESLDCTQLERNWFDIHLFKWKLLIFNVSIV